MRKFLLVCIGCVAGYFLAHNFIPVGKIVNQYFSNSTSRTEVVEFIETSSAKPILDALKEFYPEEEDYFITKMVETINDQSDLELIYSSMNAVGIEIRKRHAKHLRFSSDQSLKQILDFQIKIVTKFKDQPMVCNQILMFGPGALTSAQASSLLESGLFDNVYILYSAMKEGEHSPVTRQPVTDKDYAMLVNEFRTQGGTEEQLSAIMSKDIAHPKKCEATLKYLNVLQNASFPTAASLRAESVAVMNEN